MSHIIVAALVSIGIHHGHFRYETWRTSPTVIHATVWTDATRSTVRELVVTPRGFRWLKNRTVTVQPDPAF